MTSEEIPLPLLKTLRVSKASMYKHMFKGLTTKYAHFKHVQAVIYNIRELTLSMSPSLSQVHGIWKQKKGSDFHLH